MASDLFLAGMGVIGFTGSAFLLRMYQVKRVDFVSISLGSIGFFHGLFLILCLRDSKEELISDFLYNVAFYETYSLHYFLIIISFVVMMLFGAMFCLKKTSNRVHPPLYMKMSKSYAVKLSISGWILLFIAISSYWLYSRAYGGFISIFLNARFLRAGLFDIGPQGNPWSFLGKLGGFSFMASFVFWGILLAPKNWKYRLFSGVNLIGFFLSTFFSLFVISTWFSRSHLIFYISTFIFSFIIRKYSLRINYKTFKAMVLFAILLFCLFFLSSYLTKGVRPFEGELDRLKGDASVRILPIFVLLEKSDYRWFQDILYIPLYFFPQRFWRESLVKNTASDIITIKIVGAKKGENEVKGSMVIGIIPFSFLQMGFAGVIIIGFFWGLFLKKVDRWLLYELPPGFSETIYSYIAFRFVVSSVWGADPQVVIYNHLDVLLSLLFVLIMQRISFSKIK